MKKIVLIALLWLPLVSVANSVEITHLLKFIENSGCTFERNGVQYDSREAREHINSKYEHIENHVHSAEDFIRYAATRSSMSGRLYHVICEGNKITSAEWLHGELTRFRSR